MPIFMSKKTRQTMRKRKKAPETVNDKSTTRIVTDQHEKDGDDKNALPLTDEEIEERYNNNISYVINRSTSNSRKRLRRDASEAIHSTNSTMQDKSITEVEEPNSTKVDSETNDESPNIISSSNKYEVTEGVVTVYIPTKLTVKESKKFRKDTRRKISREQEEDLTDITIVFLPEEIEEEPQKKKPKSFPRINELLEAEQNNNRTSKSKDKNANCVTHMTAEEKARFVAMDCEMVGIGLKGYTSALARVSLVDFSGSVILDQYAQVPVAVTNFRTHVSGIKPSDIHRHNPNSVPIDELRNKVGAILMNKVLVGHALKNDMKALTMTHPGGDVRDTAKFKPFMKNVNKDNRGSKLISRKLRDLASEELGMIIQEEGKPHDSIQDATAAMELYKSKRYEWEKDVELRKRQRRRK